MCSFFKIYPTPRIHRRNRKYLAALSLSSGLTMLLMVHQTSILVAPMESQMMPMVLSTNNTPVDYFVPNEEVPSEFPVTDYLSSESKLLKKLLQKDFKNQNDPEFIPTFLDQHKTISENKVSEEENSRLEAAIRKDLLTTDSGQTCCKEDFHQSPYVTETHLRPSWKSEKEKALEKRREIFKKLKYSTTIFPHWMKKEAKGDFLKGIVDVDKKSTIEDKKMFPKSLKSRERESKNRNKKKQKKSNSLQTNNNFLSDDESFLSLLNKNSRLNGIHENGGDTIINIKIGNPPPPTNKVFTTTSSQFKFFADEYAKQNEETDRLNKETHSDLDWEKYNSSSSVIDIPEVTFSNVSYISLKEQKLKEILSKINIDKIFTNSTYKKLILSRDLSQWNDLLSLPEDNIENTYEPNRVVENYEYRTARPGDIENGENLVRKVLPQSDKLEQGYLRIKNNFPNELLREIPRQRIRKSFHIRSDEGKSFLASGESHLASQIGIKKGVRRSSVVVYSPSSEYRNVLYPFHLDYTRPAYFPWTSTKDECSSHATRFLVGGTGKIVPLASFPGSGNTWLRYISETLTGVFSGSLYEDDILAIRGFWGERDSYIEGTTLLQKTHSFPALPTEISDWDGRMILGPAPRKILLLIRSPYEALVSLRHFHAAGHTGFGHHSAFAGRGWDNFTEIRANSWLKLNKAWLELPNSKVLVIHYEMLMQNLEHEAKRLLKFLGIPLDYGRLSCLQRYPEGKFRRPRYPKHLQGYQISKKAASTLATAITALNQVLAFHGHTTLPTQLYSYHPPTKETPSTT